MATCQTVAGTEVAWSCHHHVWHLKIREVGASMVNETARLSSAETI